MPFIKTGETMGRDCHTLEKNVTSVVRTPGLSYLWEWENKKREERPWQYMGRLKFE